MHDICQVESTTAVDASQIYRISFLSIPIIAMSVLVSSGPPKKQFFNFFWSKYQFFCKIDKNKKFLEFFFTKYNEKGGFKNPQIMIESTIISKTIRFIKIFIKTNVFIIAFYILVPNFISIGPIIKKWGLGVPTYFGKYSFYRKISLSKCF